jgi:hypothetical protein
MPQANTKLNLLNSITRHNQINTMAGMFGLIDMAKDPSCHSDLDNLPDDIKIPAENFNQEIGYTRDYHAIGISEPHWHSREEILNRAIKPFVACWITENY